MRLVHTHMRTPAALLQVYKCVCVCPDFSQPKCYMENDDIFANQWGKMSDNCSCIVHYSQS